MALQVERQLTITNLIRSKNTVSVEELSKMFDVSLNTIRRDLSILETKGLLKRTQGGALLVEVNQFVEPFHIRKSEYTDEKELIGKAAVQLVSENDTIIIDAGTTTLELAKNLNGFQRLTVLTNSLEVANELIYNSNISVILSGGVLRQSSRSLFGLPTEQFFSQFHADKLFLSVGGISIADGLTNPNINETAVKRKMIEAAKEIIVLVDYHKFDRVSLSPITSLNSVHKIVTDTKIPRATLQELEKLGIEVVIA